MEKDPREERSRRNSLTGSASLRIKSAPATPRIENDGSMVESSEGPGESVGEVDGLKETMSANESTTLEVGSNGESGTGLKEIRATD